MAKQTIIHLSDLHIGRSEKESERTIKLFNVIARNYPKVLVIITGDLTDSATKNQFKKIRNFLDKLAKTNPILAVPGNHDYAWMGNILRPNGWKNWVHYLGSPLGWGRDTLPWMELDHEPEGVDGLGVWKDGACAFFGVDSGDPNDKVISARGFISEKLAKALKKSLQMYAGKTRIVLLHHHPFTDGFFTKLHGSEIFLKSIKNSCELVLFGHEHKYGIWWGKLGIPLMVSSHKSTNLISGDCLMYTLIDIENAGTPDVLLNHRLEVV